MRAANRFNGLLLFWEISLWEQEQFLDVLEWKPLETVSYDFVMR
jgi:hypothetical protein